MKYQREIKFKTNESKSKLTAGTTCYQGQVIHNLTLDRDETLRAFSDYVGLGKAMAPMYVQLIGSFIAEQVAQGNHLDFGAFSVGLKMRGGFPAANSKFDPEVNSLSVEITPSKEIRKAADELKPVNITVEQPIIYCVAQVEPDLTRGKMPLYDTVSAVGHRKVQCNGRDVEIHRGVADEGVWIENDDGMRLATGEVYSGDAATCDFVLDEPIAPGVYWLVIAARSGNSPHLLRSKRHIRVIANS